MSEDNNVGNVSKKLRGLRFSAKYVHTRNSKFEAEMWNTGDTQFLGLLKERVSTHDTSARRYSFDEIRITFFGTHYFFDSNEKAKHLSKAINPIYIRPRIAQGLRDFLVQKPANETFVIPDFRGGYHLSFAKRSLFGPTELRWRFLHDEQEWLDAFKLSRKKKKDALKDMKRKEARQQLWFADEQSDKLIAYLDSVLPHYATLPPHAFVR